MESATRHLHMRSCTPLCGWKLVMIPFECSWRDQTVQEMFLHWW